MRGLFEKEQRERGKVSVPTKLGLAVVCAESKRTGDLSLAVTLLNGAWV